MGITFVYSINFENNRIEMGSIYPGKNGKPENGKSATRSQRTQRYEAKK
jgi:hypothetical protein